MTLARTLAIFVCLTLTYAPGLAQGPRRAPPPGPPAGMGPGAPVLTRQDVEKLVVVIPELARESGNMSANPPVNAMGAIGQANAGNVPIEDIERVEKLLLKYGYTFPDFFVKLSVLLSTYMALKPEEFDKQLPTEETPAIKRILEDPEVTAEQKKAIREQLAITQENKEALRAQFLQHATDENKKVVKPLLAKVEQALKVAEKLSLEAREKAMTREKRGPRKARKADAP